MLYKTYLAQIKILKFKMADGRHVRRHRFRLLDFPIFAKFCVKTQNPTVIMSNIKNFQTPSNMVNNRLK